MKTFLVYTFLAFLNFVINFAIYNYSFNNQATPFLHEEQRVDSALLMLKTTLPAYIISSIFLTVLFYLVANEYSRANRTPIPRETGQ
ncbi:MAG: hypothetical protein KJ630_18705 [Proteobacteria bacterium]|nr:hypothetical protein [Pseudomonadota bacterium]